MAQMQKFLFDTTFDAERQGAARPAKKPPPKFTDEDLAEATNKSFADGQLAGLDEARVGIEQQAAEALAMLAQQLDGLGRQLAEATASHEEQTLRFVTMALGKLLPEVTRRHALTEVESLVTECFEMLREEPRVVVRTADCLHDALRARIETMAEGTGFDGRVVLLTEETLQPGDVRIEWADGGIERDTARIWSEIEAILDRALENPAFPCRDPSDSPDRPEPAAPATDDTASAPQSAGPGAPGSDITAAEAAAQAAPEPIETGDKS